MTKGRRSVADIGEFDLIARLKRGTDPAQAVMGIGDDAAILRAGKTELILATIDMNVEGVHFPAGDDEGRAVGMQAMRANLSDIAAMGGQPDFALVSLALPPATPVDFVDSLYEGLTLEADRFDVGIVGGNLSRTSGPKIVDVAVLGSVPRAEVVYRKGARVGDMLAVTGVLGRSAARRLENEVRRETPGPTTAQHDTMPPRVREGRALAQLKLVDAMIDITDGLAADVRHLAEASGVGVVIYEANLPIDELVHGLKGHSNLDPLSLALAGGEDYELLAALPEDHVGRAQSAIRPCALTVVGKIVPHEEGLTLVRKNGRSEDLPAVGWTHF